MIEEFSSLILCLLQQSLIVDCVTFNVLLESLKLCFISLLDSFRSRLMLKFIETIVDHENYVSKEDKKKHKHQPITNLKLHLATCNKVCEQEHVEDGDVDHQLI